MSTGGRFWCEGVRSVSDLFGWARWSLSRLCVVFMPLGDAVGSRCAMRRSCRVMLPVELDLQRDGSRTLLYLDADGSDGGNQMPWSSGQSQWFTSRTRLYPDADDSDGSNQMLTAPFIHYLRVRRTFCAVLSAGHCGQGHVFYTVPRRAVPCCAALSFAVLNCSVLKCSVLCCSVLY